MPDRDPAGYARNRVYFAGGALIARCFLPDAPIQPALAQLAGIVPELVPLFVAAVYIPLGLVVLREKRWAVNTALLLLAAESIVLLVAAAGGIAVDSLTIGLIVLLHTAKDALDNIAYLTSRRNAGLA